MSRLLSKLVSSRSYSTIKLPGNWDKPPSRGRPTSTCSSCGWRKSADAIIFPGGIYLPESFSRQSISLTAWRGCFRCMLVVACWDKLDENAVLTLPGPNAGNYVDRGSIPWELFVLFNSGWDLSGFSARVYKRITTGDTSSETSFEWAQTQLSVCHRAHNCTKISRSFRPTRLLDVNAFSLSDASQDVVLVETANLPVSDSFRYLTLSHCWGGEMPECLTTRSTLEDRLRRIPWALFPKTFQDAVTFTRRLEERYLWIDSLCIIQKDEEDWHLESAAMYDVYKNSYLTLAATWAPAGSHGLFSTTEQPIHVTTVVNSNGSHKLYGRPFRHHIFGWESDPLNDNPLLSRAWVYQERAISPRVLFFTRSELAWQCCEYFDCECGRFGDREPRDQGRQKLTQSIGLLSSGSADDALWEVQKPWWHKIVETYSVLSLTVSNDKLPAIGAIAREIHRSRPGETYNAGLWSFSFREDMLWYTRDFVEGRVIGQGGARHTRPHPLPAPTWSWASVRDRVQFWFTDPPVRMLFEVKRIAVEPQGKDPYGRAQRGGRVTVVGHTMFDNEPISSMITGDGNGSWWFKTGKAMNQKDSFLPMGIRAELYLDAQLNASSHFPNIPRLPRGCISACLFMLARCAEGLRFWSYSDEAVLFLLLALHNDGTYHRLGFVVIGVQVSRYSSDWDCFLPRASHPPRELVIL